MEGKKKLMDSPKKEKKKKLMEILNKKGKQMKI